MPLVECPNHQGGWDCSPFCKLCGGEQEYETNEERGTSKMNETETKLYLASCDFCPERYPAIVKFVKVWDQWRVSNWLETIHPLAGSDWLATWCESCGPQHQNELNIREWQRRKQEND
jgi:hypothetical protein